MKMRDRRRKEKSREQWMDGWNKKLAQQTSLKKNVDWELWRSPDGSTGAGVYCNLFQSYTTLGKNRTAFDGEIQAIFNALQQ